MNLLNYVSLPGFFLNTCRSVKTFLSGEKTANEACSNVVYETTKNAVVGIGKEMLNNAIGPTTKMVNIGVGVAVNIAATGTEGVFTQDQELVTNMFRVGVCTLNTTLLGPICSVPLNIIADKAIDLGIKANKIGFNNAYKNFKLHNDYLDLRYIKDFSASLNQIKMDHEDLGMSFIGLSAPAA